jgi:hypothetical protein
VPCFRPVVPSAYEIDISGVSGSTRNLIEIRQRTMVQTAPDLIRSVGLVVSRSILCKLQAVPQRPTQLDGFAEKPVGLQIWQYEYLIGGALRNFLRSSEREYDLV